MVVAAGPLESAGVRRARAARAGQSPPTWGNRRLASLSPLPLALSHSSPDRSSETKRCSLPSLTRSSRPRPRSTARRRESTPARTRRPVRHPVRHHLGPRTGKGAQAAARRQDRAGRRRHRRTRRRRGGGGGRGPRCMTTLSLSLQSRRATDRGNCCTSSARRADPGG